MWSLFGPFKEQKNKKDLMYAHWWWANSAFLFKSAEKSKEIENFTVRFGLYTKNKPAGQYEPPPPLDARLQLVGRSNRFVGTLIPTYVVGTLSDSMMPNKTEIVKPKKTFFNVKLSDSMMPNNTESVMPNKTFLNMKISDSMMPNKTGNVTFNKTLLICNYLTVWCPVRLKVWPH